MNAEDVKSWVSALAFALSLISLVVSWRTNRLSAIAARRPVLVFVYDSQRGWRVKNVGKGPALDIIVASKRVGAEWFDPVRIPPLSDGDAFELSWCRHANDVGLGATYLDVAGVAYSSKCGNDLSTAQAGRILPYWKEGDIRCHWHHPNSA